MLEDNFPAAGRIISEIASSFKKDPKLKSFEIIVEPESQNKSPVHLVEHCLGLESWCVPHLYYHAYRNIMALSVKNTRLKFKDPENFTNLLTAALLLNPEVDSFWNFRRQLLKLGHLHPFDELHFSSVVLSHKPKCGLIFNYRRWVFSILYKEDADNSTLIANEFQVILKAAEDYACNYNAWNHCLWCIKLISVPSDLLDLLIHLDSWFSRHVSDHSALSFRQALIKHFNSIYTSAQVPPTLSSQQLTIIKDSVEYFCRNVNDSLFTEIISSPSLFIPLGLVLNEFRFSSDLISRFPGHEALWSHRRFIVFYFCTYILRAPISTEHVQFNHSEFFSLENNDTIPCNEDSNLCLFESRLCNSLKSVVFLYEKEFLSSCDITDNAKYSKKYKMWTKNVLKIDFDDSGGLHH